MLALKLWQHALILILIVFSLALFCFCCTKKGMNCEIVFVIMVRICYNIISHKLGLPLYGV